MLSLRAMSSCPIVALCTYAPVPHKVNRLDALRSGDLDNSLSHLPGNPGSMSFPTKTTQDVFSHRAISTVLNYPVAFLQLDEIVQHVVGRWGIDLCIP